VKSLSWYWNPKGELGFPIPEGRGFVNFLILSIPLLLAVLASSACSSSRPGANQSGLDVVTPVSVVSSEELECQLRGTLLDEEGKGCGGVEVWLWGEPSNKRMYFALASADYSTLHTTSTDMEGTFRYAGIPAGRHRIGPAPTNNKGFAARCDDVIISHPGDCVEVIL